MKNLNNLFIDGSIIIVPSELKTYLLELKTENPFLNFKLFTINELFKELRGNYFDTKVLNLAFQFFPELTYASIKEVSEMVFKSFEIQNSSDDNLINFSQALIKEGLLTENEDLKLLLQNRQVVFINFEDSTLVKKLIEHLDIKRYKFISITEIVESSKEPSYHAFFNISDETKYFLNEMLDEIESGKDTSKIDVVCDCERFDYFLNLFLSDIDIPYEFENSGRAHV